MSTLSVSNSFIAGTTADASQVNTNFSDIVNYINLRNSGSSSWDGLSVLGNATITGNLTVSGTINASLPGTDGWSSVSETWTYASATTFTISGDKTSIYNVGDKLKLTQTTVKYFYVTGVSFSSPNTTITVNGGSDYSLANASITSAYYSKMMSPNGFPGSFAYTSTLTGWDNSTTRFFLNGRSCTVTAVLSKLAGGSGARSLTAPISSASNGTSICHIDAALELTTTEVDSAYALIGNSTTTINTIRRSFGSTSWGGSNEACQFTLTYLI